MDLSDAIRLPPLLIYDRTCGFCRRWVERWRSRTGPRVVYAPYQQRGVLWRAGVPRREAKRSSLLVFPNGRRWRAAAGIFRLLARTPGLRAWGWLGLLPGIKQLGEGVYRLIANHRVAAARVDRLLFGKREAAPSSRYVRWLFLRGLGLIYLAAFYSLDRQVLGLYGSEGIRPIEPLLEAARERMGPKRYRLFPTVFWLDASDAALKKACRVGETVSLALVLNLAPKLSLLVLYALYLSFTSVGGSFLSFQWDALLLETGAQSILIAPWGLAPGVGRRKPSWLAVFLMRWLAFRLHFESGIAKIQSGDQTWKQRTAAQYYYQTAPLPTKLGWRAHHLSPRLNRFSTIAALGIEYLVPWLAFGTRRMRRWCFSAFMLLQATIMATANYGFFNLLTGIISLWLLDDEDLLPRHAREARPKLAAWYDRLLVGAGAVPVLAISGARLLYRMTGHGMTEPIRKWTRQLMPFELVNPYGLFSVMTTERPEIIVQGSDDGVTWKDYEFKYKPGDPTRPPKFIVPHMPRLDWLMWFAALSGPPSWFYEFLARLLTGSRQVTELLEKNPFPDHPPRYIRALLYDYRMTDNETRRATGVWWQRRLEGEYSPTITLQRTEQPEARV